MAKKKRKPNRNAPSFSADYRQGASAPVQEGTDSELDDFLPEGEDLPDDREFAKKKEKPAPKRKADQTEETEASAKEESMEAQAEDTQEPDDSSWSSAPAVPAAPAAASSARSARARGRHRYGVVLGSLVLLLALVGVVSLAGMIGTRIYDQATDDSALRAYDEKLACIVMQDPEPFDSPETADPTFVQNAALWKSILEKRSEWTGYDDNGLAIIPLGVVASAAQELFGPDCSLSPSNPTEETFYTYDSTTNTYHVSVFSSDSAMTPYTESSRREGDTTVLTVGYVLPTDPWRTQETSSGTENTAPSPSKYMEYVMKTDPETGEEYVYAVREPG